MQMYLVLSLVFFSVNLGAMNDYKRKSSIFNWYLFSLYNTLLGLRKCKAHNIMTKWSHTDLGNCLLGFRKLFTGIIDNCLSEPESLNFCWCISHYHVIPNLDYIAKIKDNPKVLILLKIILYLQSYNNISFIIDTII